MFLRWVIVLLVLLCVPAAGARGQALLEESRESPVIEAREGAAQVKVAMPAERSTIVNRKARFAWDEKAKFYGLTFLPEEGKADESPRLALPNSRLELIEKILAEHPDAVFTISGETTVYEKKAYLLIRLATVELPARPTDVANQTSPPADTTESATQEVSAPTTPSTPSLSPEEAWLLEPDEDDPPAKDPQEDNPPSAEPAVEPAEPATENQADESDESAAPADADQPPPQTSAGGDPDAVIEAMLKERPGTPILAPVETDTPVIEQPSVAPLPKAVRMQLPSMFGPTLNERVVRLGRDKEGWWILRFENDNGLAQPPLRVLPSSNLTKARTFSRSQTGVELRIVVWGEIVHYKGMQYILLQRVTKHHTLNRF